MISLCCHFSCEYDGRGRIGNGGVTYCGVEMESCSSENRIVAYKE